LFLPPQIQQNILTLYIHCDIVIKIGKIMIKKLSKYGNSYAIIIDKPILELLNITHDTGLKIKTDGKKIIIEPVKNVTLEKLYKKNARKYASDLKKLAKS